MSVDCPAATSPLSSIGCSNRYAPPVSTLGRCGPARLHVGI